MASLQIFDNESRIRDHNDSYMEVILETGASIELAPKTSKLDDTRLLEQLKVEAVKDREDSKFCISVSYYIVIEYRIIKIHDSLTNLESIIF